jgi:uncharacterized RDD family membrane protein YckC
VKQNGQIVVIETPEHLELDFKLAGIGSRFMAYLIDRLIQWGFILIVILLGALAIHFAGKVVRLDQIYAGLEKEAPKWIIAIMFLTYGTITIGYFIIFEYFWNGRTPGKRWQRIRVMKRDGTPVTFLDSAIRNILRFVDILGDVYPVGLAVMFLDSRNRRLGDLAAGTLVIQEQELPVPVFRDTAHAPGDSDAHLREVVARMTPADFSLVVRFLSRRSSMDTEPRRDLAQEIYTGLAGESLAAGLDGQDPEISLERLESLYRKSTRIL